MELKKSVIRITKDGNTAWYHANPSGENLLLRRIPFNSAERLGDGDRKLATELDGKQYTFSEATKLTGLPVRKFSIEEPEAWMLVVRRLEGRPSAQPQTEGEGRGPSLDREIARGLDWEGQKDLCDDNIKTLGDRWRINDDRGEGVLFAKRALVDSDDGLPQATVARSNLENEVGLSYALFNARDEISVSPNGYRIISWEAPLLRPTARGLGVPTVRCDLIAYNAQEKRLVAVEVKLNPENEATEIQHGFRQAMEYGHILQQCLITDERGLKQQVDNCLRRWCKQVDQCPEVKEIAYALAAPKKYFSDSLRMYKEQGKECLRGEIDINPQDFDAFWVLDCRKVQATEVDEVDEADGDSRVIPTVDCNIKRLGTLKDLENHCS